MYYIISVNIGWDSNLEGTGTRSGDSCKQNNVECEWNILAPADFSIEISFHDFKLESTFTCHTIKPCKCDNVKILDGHNMTKASIYCMEKQYLPHGVIHFPVNHVIVLFRSDSTITERGFNATYVMRPPDPGMNI